jgi:hypothetical protein
MPKLSWKVGLALCLFPLTSTPLSRSLASISIRMLKIGEGCIGCSPRPLNERTTSTALASLAYQLPATISYHTTKIGEHDLAIPPSSTRQPFSHIGPHAIIWDRRWRPGDDRTRPEFFHTFDDWPCLHSHLESGLLLCLTRPSMPSLPILDSPVSKPFTCPGVYHQSFRS